MQFRARILGAAAGGGLPQWNCGCENCRLARAGEIPAQTQSSLAVSANGTDWAILNASPDIRAQLATTPELHPTGLREMPLRSASWSSVSPASARSAARRRASRAVRSPEGAGRAFSDRASIGESPRFSL